MMSNLGDCGKREAFWDALRINRQERILASDGRVREECPDMVCQSRGGCGVVPLVAFDQVP